jgi:predicted transcriptional regulator
MDKMNENPPYSIEPRRDNMPTPSSDRAAKSILMAIEMSAASLAKWKAMLSARKIGTAKKLRSRVPEIMGEPTARRAFNGQRLDRETWQAIFEIEARTGGFFY